jgi:hypothetical protein
MVEAFVGGNFARYQLQAANGVSQRSSTSLLVQVLNESGVG